MSPAASGAGTPAERQAVIRTEALTKIFGSGPTAFTAVEDLDLEVGRGELFGLLGPNGAGKTTTIGMLTTRVVPTAGRARINGVDVTDRPARVKRSIGVVPQTNTLDRSLTVADNLYFHGRYFGMGAAGSRRRTAELLDRFRLAEKAQVSVSTLSGGMAQRLMVARAVMHRPAVLFLDEPTTGLDPQSRIALWDMMTELHAAGQTILLTTHYMEEAERLCDRVAIMDHGAMLTVGTPRQLTASVDADTVISLAAGPEQLEALAVAVLRVDGVRRSDVHDGRVRVFTARARGLLPNLIAAADRADLPVSDVTVAEPNLETVFIALTGRDLRE